MATLARKICLCPYQLYNHKSHISSSLSHYFSTCTTGNVQFLIQNYHFSPQTAAMVSSFLKNPQRTQSVLEFLKETGFSDTQLERMVRSDHRLVSTRLVKTIKSKIKTFEDLGFSDVEIVAIVANDPSILGRSVINAIIPLLSVLKGLLGSNAQVTKFLTRTGWRMGRDLNKTLLPNIEFLKSCGVALKQINSFIFTCPLFLLLKPENMKRFVHKVDEMGVDRTTKVFIHAVRVVSSMSDANCELKLKNFRDLGFSEDDIVRVFRNDPTVFAVSGQKIRKIKEVMLETGKYDLSSIRKCPASFTCSVEKRYKPRLQILKDLEKKGLICKWPALATLATMTDNEFRMRFVALLGNETGKEFAG